MSLKFELCILLLLSFAVSSTAQKDTTEFKTSKETCGVVCETMLHPADAFTAYTFKKGEWSVNKAIQLLPIPEWIFWGITDWLTVELDLEANLGGVPSINLRFALAKQKRMRPALAYETMYQYIPNKFDLLGGGGGEDSILNVIRGGNHNFQHLNASWKLADSWHLHISAGATYTQYLQLADTLSGKSKTFNNLISPDFSAGIDWRAKDWISLHSAASYGSTFAYLDNVALKQQFAFTARVAPFVSNKYGFLRAFRMDIAIVSFYFKDAGNRITGPVGFIYWQWQGGKKKKQKKKSSEL